MAFKFVNNPSFHGKFIKFLVFSLLYIATTADRWDSEEDDEGKEQIRQNSYLIHDMVKDLHYSKYLTQVINILKRDPKRHAKVHFETLSAGNPAEHYKDIEPITQMQLDDLKRGELRRIKTYSEELKRQGQLDKNVVRHQIKQAMQHVDAKNAAEFGPEDLRKLVLQAKADLTVIDNYRKERFKSYEMHKLLEFEELYKRLSLKEQAQVSKVREEVLLEHRRRKPSHLPGSQQHLMQVWEEKDKMDKENFNLKTFFHMHDLDGNSYLDEVEIKTLMESEVADYYDPESPDYDKTVKEEELERMREFVFETIDLDGDHLINLEEFIINAKHTGYDEHIFWEHVKRVQIFTPEEYKTFADKNRAEVNKLIDEGKISLPLSGFVKHNEDQNAGKKDEKI